MEWLEPQDFSKNLRKAMTPAEYLLWQCLRNLQRCHAKFRRQYVKGIYTLDFFCPNPLSSLEKYVFPCNNLPEKRKKPATVHYTIVGLNT